MKTVTLDILDEKAINLLKDLEGLNIIRIQVDEEIIETSGKSLSKKYSGAMSKQSIKEIDKQLKELRDEWS